MTGFNCGMEAGVVLHPAMIGRQVGRMRGQFEMEAVLSQDAQQRGAKAVFALAGVDGQANPTTSSADELAKPFVVRRRDDGACGVEGGG